MTKLYCSWPYSYFTEGTLCTVHYGPEHTHAIIEETLHACHGVGSPLPFQEAESFSCMPYNMGVAAAMGQFAE